MKAEKVFIPPKLHQLLSSPKPIKVAHGGRGGAKSHAFSLYALTKGTREKMNILCAREFQTNIRDSSLATLEAYISKIPQFSQFYQVQANRIIGNNGTEFIFKGLKKEGIGGIKSLEDIALCWVDEAQYVSQKSWDILIPTITRNQGYEMLISFNRDTESDPVYTEFCTGRRADKTEVLQVNYFDNPFISQDFIDDAEETKRTDYDLYRHIYLGEPVVHSAAQVFNGKWFIDEFETPTNAKFYHGADWGFASDPTALIRCYINGKSLYIDQEAGGVGIDIDITPSLFDNIPTARHSVVYADSARPETISYMRRNGYAGVTAAKKWAGSVEDGIAYLRSFERIVIHPRCKRIAEEMRMYSYKTNKQTGEILNLVEDKHNHYIDALRYALGEFIRPRAKAEYSKALNDYL